ncbi:MULTISPECIES: hypothetical protein [Peribacillus]|uniref:DUF4181 domain-containing protein n=1 Tax=Peribacillus simplex TaxID=1478 RepID=A0A109N1Z0_9BACI|nr:hypothetical protein [Peribacillus simplex]KWW22023.1 hypothetical protein AS888_05980 [Peribacillus simplex]
MERNKQGRYVNMILGTIGPMLIALAALRYLAKGDSSGYIIIFFGFILTIGYISYLEKKAGISKKWTAIRVIVTLVVLLLFTYPLYF